MPREPRAVVFDLDDTLYPYRRFRVSGFLAVARHLQATVGLDARLAFASLLRASRGLDAGREVQAMLEQHDLPAHHAPALVDVLRHHTPTLRLPASALRTLGTLRRHGWSIGVLTNGQPTIQARKVAALGLGPLVDTVVYAAAHGTGIGKPDPEPFAEVVRQLGVRPHRVVFVGDDERCDIAGAFRAGLLAVRCAVWTRTENETDAMATARRLTQIPLIARALLEEASNRHAA